MDKRSIDDMRNICVRLLLAWEKFPELSLLEFLAKAGGDNIPGDLLALADLDFIKTIEAFSNLRKE